MPESNLKQRFALHSLTRVPAIPLVFFFASGIAVYRLIPFPSASIITIAAIVLLLWGVLRRFTSFAAIIIGLTILLCGAGLARRQAVQYPADQIGLFAADEPCLAQVELRLLDEPALIEGSFGQSRPLPAKEFVTAEAVRIKTWSGWVSCSGQTILQVEQIHSDLKPGQIVRVFGMLQRPPPADNPGQFDWAGYYRDQRILATITASRNGNVEIIENRAPSLLIQLRIATRHLLARGFDPDHAVQGALLRALLLGDHDPHLRPIFEEFESIGAAYQITVSGLHIAILGGFVWWIGRLLRLRPGWSLAITIGFVLLYAIIALPSVSGERSAIIFVAIAVASVAGRAAQRAQMLALAGFVVLCNRPLDLFSWSFQFSFVAVTGLAIFLPRLKDWRLSLRDPDVVVAGNLYKRTALERFLLACFNKLIDGVLLTIVGWLSILPLLARSSSALNPWSILSSLTLLPISLIALFAGFAKILFTLAFPAASHFFALTAGLSATELIRTARFFAKLPGNKIFLAPPPCIIFFAYYALLLFPLFLHYLKISRLQRRVFLCSPVLGLLLLIVGAVRPDAVSSATHPSQLRVTLLSVGAGQCAVIEPPGTGPILFDAGSSTISDPIRKILGPFLRFDGQRRVHEIFLSHGDYDHMSAAGEIVAAYDVREVDISPHFRRNAVNNHPDEMLLETLKQLNLPVRVIERGNHFELGGGATLDVLWPPRTGTWNSNNAGLVLRLTYAGRRILFPADIQDPAFEGLLTHPGQLHADVLVAPHHGSSESLTPEFLQAVSPRIIVSSNAWRLTNKQKRFNKMTGPPPLLRTSEYGAISIVVTGEGKMTVSTFLKNRQFKF